MERTRLSSLLVIALLQLSQTDISSTLPEAWYAANVINDGVNSKPQPWSEIYSTEPTFSSMNPMFVLPKWTSTQSPPLAIRIPPQHPSVSTFSVTTPPPLPQLLQLPELPQFQQPPPPPSPPPIVFIPQGIQIQSASQGSPLMPQLIHNQPPNYFLLYQQLSQNVQGYPANTSQLPSSSLSPAITSTTLPTSITTTTLPLSSSTTRAPSANNTPSVPQASTQFPTFRILMLAPNGSETNFRIDANPTATTTTTRRPTTTRTRRRNRNNYDGCVDGCGETRVPICASPLGVSPINPDRLKGFPSVCHMACNNSFRKNLFVKVMDGKCGKLRTRIRPINSNEKLKRDELNRASYTIVHGGEAVVEFSHLTT